DTLEREHLLPPNGASALSGLRFLKCLYRAGEQDRGERVLASLNRLLCYLPDWAFPKSVTLKDPAIILSDVSPNETVSAYLLLRDLERRFLALKLLDPGVIVD